MSKLVVTTIAASIKNEVVEMAHAITNLIKIIEDKNSYIASLAREQASNAKYHIVQPRMVQIFYCIFIKKHPKELNNEPCKRRIHVNLDEVTKPNNTRITFILFDFI